MTDDDNRYLSPLEGPLDPNCPHVTVDCSRGGCRMSFFVAKDDPRLPDGPFLCADHDDVPVKRMAPSHSEAIVICDRCEAQLTAEGPTREAAVAKLRVMITERHWKVIDRFDSDGNVVAPSTVTAPDLCGDCAAQR